MYNSNVFQAKIVNDIPIYDFNNKTIEWNDVYDYK